MRITKLMGLSVMVVALAVVINTLALSSATVNSTFSLGIVASNAALISLSAPTGPDLDLTIDDTGAKYSLSVEDGIQADSTYVFKNAVLITNRSDNSVILGYSSNKGANITTLALKNATGDADIAGLTVAAGGTVTAYLEVVTNASATSTDNATSITITATKP